MNRKHNPFVSLVALLLAAVILVLFCAGCSERAAAAEPARFTVEYGGGAHGLDFYIITDTQTGVQYLYTDSYNAGGVTVLLPGEG